MSFFSDAIFPEVTALDYSSPNGLASLWSCWWGILTEQYIFSSFSFFSPGLNYPQAAAHSKWIIYSEVTHRRVSYWGTSEIWSQCWVLSFVISIGWAVGNLSKEQRTSLGLCLCFWSQAKSAPGCLCVCICRASEEDERCAPFCHFLFTHSDCGHKREVTLLMDNWSVPRLRGQAPIVQRSCIDVPAIL